MILLLGLHVQYRTFHEGGNMTFLYIILGIIGVIIVFLFTLYNSLVTLRARIQEAWSQIDVQLKRRIDLIPNLVETVKGYATHEKTVFAEVTKARADMMSAKTPAGKGEASAALTGALGKLIAVAENYPQLKANDGFIQLQKELSDTEDKVAYSRQYYNSTVMEYNVKIQVFPNNLLAKNLGFSEKEFFGASDEERKAVSVKF
jgi:LemA protein